MFDYVSREKFESEHALRLRADAALERASEQIASLYEAHAQLLKMVESERERHEEAMKDALDRFAPKPKDPVPGFGVVANLPTYEEILRMPAVGKRGVRERNAAALEAKTREELAEKEDDVAKRRATLTPEEQAVVDQQITR
jgi:hypothetical protein